MLFRSVRFRRGEPRFPGRPRRGARTGLPHGAGSDRIDSAGRGLHRHDFSALTDLDAFALNDLLAREFSVVGIPVPALCRPGSPAHSAYRSSIRYSFCKSVADVDKGAQMLITLGSHLKQHPDALRG